MALFLIQDDRVVGSVSDPASFPERLILEGPDLSPIEVFYNPSTEQVEAKPEQPSPDHYWNEDEREWQQPMESEPEVIERSAEWRPFMLEFMAPSLGTNAASHALYESALAKAIAAGPLAQWRLQNLQQVITNPELRRVDGLALSINQLAGALAQGGHPFSTLDRNAWNALITKHYFPNICLLKSPA